MWQLILAATIQVALVRCGSSSEAHDVCSPTAEHAATADCEDHFHAMLQKAAATAAAGEVMEGAPYVVIRSGIPGTAVEDGAGIQYRSPVSPMFHYMPALAEKREEQDAEEVSDAAVERHRKNAAGSEELEDMEHARHHVEEARSFDPHGGHDDLSEKEEERLEEHLEHASTHYSIFQMRFNQVNRLAFWVIFSLMLVFTIAIDRLQAFAQTRVAHSSTEKMFLERINSELMMFGCVGLFMFVLENSVTHLPDDQAKLVEFVDILCSMGACNLIVEAFMLFLVRSLFAQRWHRLEMERLPRTHKPTKPGILPLMEPSQFQYMASRFRQQHKLPLQFEYYRYLNECLARTACELMNIDWRMWLALLCMTGAFAASIYSGFQFKVNTAEIYFDIILVVNWGSFTFFFTLFLLALHAHVRLTHFFFRIRTDANDITPRFMETERNWHSWTMYMQVAMQAACLTNSFLISLYVMLVNFNLRKEGYRWHWAFFLLLPLLLSLLVLMPLMVCSFTVVRAYFDSEPGAVDVVLEMATRLQEDLRYLRQRLESQGGMKVLDNHFQRHPTVDMTEEDLLKLMRNLGVHISKERLHRICVDIDTEETGLVEVEEFLNLLKKIDT
mmetsp:Transcript_36423/g.66723  ORF Transcript_36423/g.66723 Transcript_36423/m.66723 type:complete len:614 (+) Transcript_36423:107-1948(+)